MGDSRVPPWMPLASQVVEGMVAWDGGEPPTRGFSVESEDDPKKDDDGK